MKAAPRRWEISEALPIPGQSLVLGRVLAGRGLDGAEAAAFLSGGIELLDPFGLEGMADAVVTVGVAVTEGRRIAVGRFVRPELRRALADELRAALRR